MRTNQRFVKSGLARAILRTALCAGLLMQPGCIILLSATAVTIAKMRSPKFHTASVVVKGDAKETFDRLLEEVQKDPLLKVLLVDHENFQADFEQDGQYGSLQIVQVNHQQIQVISTVDTGQVDDAEDLSVQIVERACEIIGVEYETPIREPKR